MIASVVLVAAVVLVALSGHDAASVGGAFWRGAFGSWYAITSATLVRATPLVLTGLAVALAFSAGILNIGAEGQLLAGAAAAAVVGLGLGKILGGWCVVPELLAGAIAGAAWSAAPAIMRARLGVLEVISTIMMNFLAVYAVGYLVRGPLQEPLHVYPQSASIPDAARLPILLPGTRLHAGALVAVAACVVAWWVLRSTAAGFRLRLIGANENAARISGRVNVSAVSVRVFLVSGALAGLAGAVELTGVTGALYENLSPGYGYSAIAVALLAGLNPLGVIAAGLGFGALEAGAAGMQRDAGVPSVVAVAIEAAVILIVLAVPPGTLWRRRAAEEMPA